jgi:aspartyl-tRNA(Asn)/glutamyl-tRNA(Gln) amidotransferase subunit C
VTVSVTREQVRVVAALARLHLTDEEATLFAAQLADILAHVEELEAVSDAGGELEQPVMLRAPLRMDEPPPDGLAYPPSEIAPDWQDGFFTVPRLDAMKPGAPPDAEPA